MSYLLELVIDNAIGQLESDKNKYCENVKCAFKLSSVLNDKCVLINVNSLEEANIVVGYILSIFKFTRMCNDENGEMYAINLENKVSVLVNYGEYIFDSILGSLKRAGVSVIGLDLSGLLFW